MGYGDELPKGEYIIDRKYLVTIIVGISIVVIGIGVWYLLPESIEEEVSELYDLGKWAINNGDLMKAADYYSHIIEIAPNEEKAWHEKGKILNRLQICEKAVSHYEKYVMNFPKSSRAQEGYNIAKNCEL